MLSKNTGFHRWISFLVYAATLTCWGVVLAQTQMANHQAAPGRPGVLALNQTQYRLRAGESTTVDATSEALGFLVRAKTRRVEIAGNEVHGIVVGPNRVGDQILLAVSLAMKPGEYTLALSATNEAGENRGAILTVTVDALAPVPSSATEPPVILLNGWQPPSLLPPSSCPILPASDTFGNLEDYLQSDGVPVVYWFDNCTVCQNCAIETLGSDLSQAIASIQYDNGTPVPQVDLIAHSMGGLIIRSYLSGKQTTSGAFDPPINPKVRKAIFIATPHFGSFQADNLAADVLFFAGSQTNEMKPGSQFLFDLAKWNQFQDDLRGIDALGIIGNAGSYNGVQGASDGVVSLTSASIKLTSFSLAYAEPDVRTRIVAYCHSDFTGTATSEIGSLLGCIGPGIADIDTTLHPTYQIIRSFLANTATWQDTAISTTPSVDPYLSTYGGVIIGAKSTNDQYLTNLTSLIVPNANLSFMSGPSNSVSSLFYDEWVPAGNYEFSLYDSSGDMSPDNLSTIPGGGMAIYYKEAPTIHSVGPLANMPGLTVSAGATITINGVGFGSQLCSGCQVLVAVPGSTVGYILPVSLWSDQAISASFAPANLPNVPIPGYVTIYVELSSSAWDSINIMALPSETISAAPTSLQFSYTVGGSTASAQRIQVTSSGLYALPFTATASTSSGGDWLAVSSVGTTVPAALRVAVSPAGLTAGSYTGNIHVSALGASNSSISIPVALTVAAAPVTAATFTVVLSASGQVEPFAAQSIVSAYGTNLATGTATASSLSQPTSLDGTTVTVTDSAGVARLAPLFFVSPGQVNCEIPVGTAAGAATMSIENQNEITQNATIQIGSVSPGLFALNASGLIAALVLPVDSGVQGALQPDYQLGAGNSVVPLPINLGSAADQIYLEMYGTGIRNANVSSVTVTVGGLSVPVLFAGAAPGFAGEDQVNIGPLPRTLAGQGNVNIVLTADGQAANTVNVTIQ